MRTAFVLALLLPLPLLAAEPTPEIRRDAIKPQPVGAVHTLRTIPEACARIEGLFTGKVAEPYKFTVVRTSASCQARARFVDAAKARPSEKAGWKFNDLIRVPNATCATQQAVVRIWRKSANAVPPKLDAQGRSRIYLKESVDSARKGDIAAIPVYAAAMAVEGKACSG